jgi:hypothetical protein
MLLNSVKRILSAGPLWRPTRNKRVDSNPPLLSMGRLKAAKGRVVIGKPKGIVPSRVTFLDIPNIVYII